MFPAKSLALNAGFWLKTPVSQPKLVISAAMSRIHPGQSDNAALVF
jgi:hypothetical protein